MYVIYIPQKEPNGPTPVLATYQSRRGLSKALTKFQRRYPDASVTTKEDFDKNIVKMVTRRNLLAPHNEFEIRSDQAGTCVDPSTERYWAM